MNQKLLTTDEIVVRENRLDKATRTFSRVKYVLFLLSPSQPTFTYEHSELFTKDEEIGKLCDYPVRVTVLGHIQRGGIPCAFDRELASLFGAKAVELIAAGDFGKVTSLRGNRIVAAPIEQAVEKIKTVDPACDRVKAARAIGVEFGAP